MAKYQGREVTVLDHSVPVASETVAVMHKDPTIGHEKVRRSDLQLTPEERKAELDAEFRALDAKKKHYADQDAKESRKVQPVITPTPIVTTQPPVRK